MGIEIFLLLRKLEEKANCLTSVCIWRNGEGGEGEGGRAKLACRCDKAKYLMSFKIKSGWKTGQQTHSQSLLRNRRI